jgi:hypothetical protein
VNAGVADVKGGLPLNAVVTETYRGHPAEAACESRITERWSRFGYLDGYPERKLDLSGDATWSQLAFFVTRFCRGSFGVYAGDASDSRNYAKCLDYLVERKIITSDYAAADTARRPYPHAAHIPPDGPFKKLDAAGVFVGAFALDVRNVPDLAELINNSGGIPENEMPAAAFMLANGIFYAEPNGSLDIDGNMSLYETMFAVDRLTGLLASEPDKGATYNNRLEDGVTRVRFYNDLIDGIKRRNELIFDNYKLEESYKKCVEIVNGTAERAAVESGLYEKELLLHDELVLTASYLKNASGGNPGDDMYSPYGVLINRAGCCESYAKAFNILLTVSGFENALIYGAADGVPHVWNLVELDGGYYHVDATWDDLRGGTSAYELSAGARTSYFYFNVTDEMISGGRTWDRGEYPVCSNDEYNFYVRENLSFADVSKAFKYVMDSIADKRDVIRIRIEGMKKGGTAVFMRALSASAAKFGVSSLSFYGPEEFIDIYPEYL